MLSFHLLIVMHFIVGIQEPLSFLGKYPYETMEACEKEGQTIADWLIQDFVTVQYYCTPQSGDDNEPTNERK